MRSIAELPSYKRQICIFASEKTKEELKVLDWKSIGFDLLFQNIFPFAFAYRLWKEKRILRDSYYKDVPFPIFDIEVARELFRFPPSHPRDGLSYATSEIESDLYVPISSFHKYMYESKMSAFTELCATLGAKTCKIVYAEENGKDVTVNFTGKNIPTSAGVLNSELNSNINRRNTQNADIFFSFPNNKNISRYETVWMNGEPTWNALQKMRLENDVDKYTADFNYTDDMGITAKIANNLNGIGIDIGGKFEEFKKIRYKFEVEFWPKK
ncbi:hypothetical protein JSO62_02580 [Riemerella anatipestifer]|uniref:hypothetical protein n=1 Tax=Riemerella anatipestifer TaxID=34085 RepID=UPI0030C2BA93